MTTFDSTKTELSKLLEEVVVGKIQLPDFQRGWVWDDEHIRSILVSIGRSFPIGAIMLLETGGDARFQERPIEGVSIPQGKEPDRLILDGQQRLTSLTQVLKLSAAVTTRDEKKREIRRYYYFDMSKALAGPNALEDAVIAIGEDRLLRENFGRDIALDLSTSEKEYESFHFPCNQILNSDAWEEGLNAAYPERFTQYMQFRKLVLNAFRSYQVPVIELKFEAMVKLGMLNSRMKDFFDLWSLSRDFAFDGKILGQAITATFEARGTVIPAEAPLALTSEFHDDRGKNAQWKAFLNKSALGADAKSLPEIADTLIEFLIPVSVAVAKAMAFNQAWKPSGPWQ